MESNLNKVIAGPQYGSVGDSIVVDEVDDPVNHPSHYTDGKIEVIDFIEDKHLNFHLGNAIKYIARSGKKNPDKEIEDLKKARWYLDRWIEHLEKEPYLKYNRINMTFDHASTAQSRADETITLT